jgi:O-antigen/teichoic acid export membrane protein
VKVGIGRLLLTGITLFAFPWAFVAIIASGIPRIWGNIQLKKITNGFVDKNAKIDAEARKEILKVVKRILPMSIYYAISGQITIWLISIFGNTISVAQIGALGRISAILPIFSVVFTTLITPRFARMRNDKIALLKRLICILAILFSLMIFVVGIIYFFSNQVLWILGENYSGLQVELLLNITASFLMLISGVVYSLYTSRGWILLPIISVSINSLSVITGIILFDISALRGILLYNIFIASCQLFLTIFYCFYIISKQHTNEMD